MMLMGGPIDHARQLRPPSTGSPSSAASTGSAAIASTPCPFRMPGMGRDVYPGFLQLSGFMAMNFERHVSAHIEMFNHLVEGDGDFAEKHRDFYDEYLAVMDLYGGILSADGRARLHPSRSAAGAVAPSRRADRPQGDPPHRALHRRGREGRYFRRRPDARPRRSSAPIFQPRARRIICRKASAITAFSTARAFAGKSRRAFRPSPRKWSASTRKDALSGSPCAGRGMRAKSAPSP